MAYGPPAPLSNQVGDLAHELDWARAHNTNLRDLRVVAGTEPFVQGALPLG